MTQQTKNKTAMVVMTFPGVGGSYYMENAPEGIDAIQIKGIMIREIDTHKVIAELKGLMLDYDIVFLEMHGELIKALEKNNISYVSVYPDAGLRHEYYGRLLECYLPNVARHFAGDGKWEYWQKLLKGQKKCFHLVLNEGEYLSDKMEDMLKIHNSLEEYLGEEYVKANGHRFKIDNLKEILALISDARNTLAKAKKLESDGMRKLDIGECIDILGATKHGIRNEIREMVVGCKESKKEGGK